MAKLTFAPNAVVTLLVAENPKTRGAAERFALYGKAEGATTTVAKYLKAVVRKGYPKRMGERDLAWDLAHGYVSVGPAA